MAVTWLIRKSGSDQNGGTSPTVQATGTDGATNGTNTLTAASNPFTAGMVGQGIFIGGVNQWRTITVFNSAGSVNFSGATIATASGRTYNVGGSWLTVNQALVTAANSVAAGDSVYVGAGTYRETVAVAKSGSAGLPISIIGDVDGAVTGDAGEVQVTNYLVNDTTAAANTATLALAATTNLAFSFITMVSGGTTSIVTDSAAGQNVTFTDCILLESGSNAALTTIGTGAVAKSWTLERCVIYCQRLNLLSVTLPTIAGSDYDSKITLRNCLLIGSAQVGITIGGSGSASGKGGGVRAYACTYLGGAAMLSTASATLSSTIPDEVHGCLIASGSGTGLTANVQGQIVEDRNLFFGSAPRTNIAIGAGSISNPAPLFDIGQAYKVSGVARPFLSPSSPTSPLLAFGSGASGGGAAIGGSPYQAFLQSSGFPPGHPNWHPPGINLHGLFGTAAVGSEVPIPTVDWANRPRPSGTQSNLTTVGYLEYHDSAIKDTNVYNDSPASAKLVGPGDIDLLIPVDANSNTISVAVRYDTNYQNSILPSVTLLADGEIGVTTQVVYAASGYWSAWQTVTLAPFTPTAASFVKLRLTSYDTSGVSAVNFDTLAVS